VQPELIPLAPTLPPRCAQPDCQGQARRPGRRSSSTDAGWRWDGCIGGRQEKSSPVHL